MIASPDVHDTHPPVFDDGQCDGQFDDTCIDMNDVTSEYDDNEEAEIDQLEQALQEQNNRELHASMASTASGDSNQLVGDYDLDMEDTCSFTLGAKVYDHTLESTEQRKFVKKAFTCREISSKELT